KKIENPRLNAEQLMSKALQLDRVHLYVSFERPLTESEINVYRSMVKRRVNHEPLQYITGMTEFMGLPIKVNPDVLIPRPETETVVEQILAYQKQNKLINILDIGTGSGCIAISLAKDQRRCKILGIDKSGRALKTAAENCQINNIPLHYEENDQDKPAHLTEGITLFKHDIMQPWPSSVVNKFDIIVSNPPYITQEEIGNLQPEVKDFEPLEALTDYSDGLAFYRRIFDLTTGNCELISRMLFLEMSGSQPEKIIALSRRYHFKNIEIIPDLNKISRVLKIEV
ncbi:MAG: peptide chain release factor N(5)-glutamine methyltransferase, partial [Calditrichaceae bacterium]